LQAVPSILSDGLPQIALTSNGSDATASIPSEKQHEPAELDESNIVPRIVCLKERLKNAPSKIQLSYRNNNQQPLNYCTEADVKKYVGEVLEDTAASLKEVLGNDFQLTFTSELESHGKKADYWVLLRHGVPVGAVEVKKPGGRGMTHKHIFGELFDYMLMVRSVDGLKSGYGILTSYREWRICWLSDTNEDVMRQDLPEKPQLRKHGQAHDLQKVPIWPCSRSSKDNKNDVENDVLEELCLNPHSASAASATSSASSEVARKLYGTKVYQYNDPDLVEILAAILVKMAFSQSTQVLKVLDKSRPYRFVGPEKWLWKQIPENICVQFHRMPSPSAENFYILFHLGTGEHGRAYLACTDNGQSSAACVLKFQQQQQEEAVGENLHQEMQRWKDIWEAQNVRVVQLAGEKALLLPYVKTCKGGADDQTDDVKEAVCEAVNHMVDRGYKHNECRWEHVGLCLSDGRLKAVLIDLGNVTPVRDDEKRAAIADMLRALDVPSKKQVFTDIV